MKKVLALMAMACALSSCAVSHSSGGNEFYGVFTGGVESSSIFK